MVKIKNIFVAGHLGMVGSALCNILKKQRYVNLITRTRSDLDLLDFASVKEFFCDQQIDEVIIAAAKVGGIYANDTYPAEFIYENLQIQNNIIHNSHIHGVQKLLFLGSSCIYPKYSKQPIKESELLTGILEPTNEPYAIAKIAGIKMCESYNKQYGRDYRSVMPTNLYGPGDNYSLMNSHVVPALINRFHKAKINNDRFATVWGTGNARREFMFVDDMASISLKIHRLSKEKFTKLTNHKFSYINIGTGIDITIRELAELISLTIGYKGDIIFDSSKPDGTPRKVMDVTFIKSLGWDEHTPLHLGLTKTYNDFLNNFEV